MATTWRAWQAPGVRVVGIDVGTRQLHAVALDGHARVVDVEVLDAARLDDAVAWVAGARAVAVDAPDRWSTQPHAADEDLSPKFRTARCCEIALAREHRIWVPWVTPTRPGDGWIRVGIDLFDALRTAGHEPVEVYPHAVFCVLGGCRPPPKQQRAGAQARIGLLEAVGLDASWLPMWSHDALDAAAAALVALDHANGEARSATCGHDGSALWLPANGDPRGSAAGVAEPSPTPFGPG